MRIWEIDGGYERDGIDFDGHMGFRHEGMSLAEEHAYKKGCEHGYRKAMEEVHGGYNERTIHHGGGYGMGHVGYRETGYEHPYMLEERRMRDARGRYI